jgi:hypothetical protein
MVELRSGTNTGGQNPSTPDGRDPNIPENIEITGQGEQDVNQAAQVQDPSQQQGQSPAAAQGVYVGGTYSATLTRAAQGTPSYRPPQFAFTTPPVRPSRPSQEDFKSTRSQEKEDGSESTKPLPPSRLPTPRRTYTFEAPMRPLDVARDMYLDYSTTQAIKFYNKGVEKLPGEAINGKLLITWLIQVQDKANMFTWTSILTIKGKPLTQNFTKITMEEVRDHAQAYQDRSSREAQNSEMLIQCLKASITRTIYNKIYLQREKYIILRKNTNELVEDGVCFLKTIIDNYHSNTRSSTKQIRKQLATLNYYMRNVAKGDVSKLCERTRELMFELNAAGETTNDLLANLIEALKEAPDSNFQRWLSNQVDLWSVRKLDWKQDGSDLMEEAEIYFQEAINTHKWGKKSHKPDVHYAFKSTTSDDEWAQVEKEPNESKKYQDEIKALTAKLKEYTTAYTARWSGPNEVNHDKKYAWKRIPPKDGEPVTKKVHVNGISKTYYWCPYHLQWTVHSPKECKRLPSGKAKNRPTDKKAIKRSQFKERKKAYIHAKAAYEACMSTSTDSDEVTSNSDKDEDSNKSASSYSSGDSNIS